MNVHEPEVFNNDTALLASDLPVAVSNPCPRLKNVHVPNPSSVIGMHTPCGTSTKVTYWPVAFIWLYSNLNFLAPAIKELVRYSNSTKLKKCIKLDPGHYRPPLDWIFVAKNLYPACFVMSTTF
jgi:hypothetical protein